MAALPEVKVEEFKNARGDAWDFLFVLTKKYFAMIDKNGEVMDEFNDFQHTLLAYNYFYGEVYNGGFIQLIQNGYGGYIFDNPFAETLKEWGAEETAKIVEEAKVIYNKHKERLEGEKSLEEFFELYKEIKEFDPLERRFYKVMKREAWKVKKYVEEHVDEFAVITG